MGGPFEVDARSEDRPAKPTKAGQQLVIVLSGPQSEHKHCPRFDGLLDFLNKVTIYARFKKRSRDIAQKSSDGRTEQGRQCPHSRPDEWLNQSGTDEKTQGTTRCQRTRGGVDFPQDFKVTIRLPYHDEQVLDLEDLLRVKFQ